MEQKIKSVTRLRAKSSVRKFGGTTEDYLPLHAWLDETHNWVSDNRHMMFRHHAQGIFEAEKRFGYTILNSDGKNIPTRVLCEMHITEDLGLIPTAEQWLNNMKMNKWMGFRDKQVIFSLREENCETNETVKEMITKKNQRV